MSTSCSGELKTRWNRHQHYASLQFADKTDSPTEEKQELLAKLKVSTKPSQGVNWRYVEKTKLMTNSTCDEGKRADASNTNCLRGLLITEGSQNCTRNCIMGFG